MSVVAYREDSLVTLIEALARSGAFTPTGADYSLLVDSSMTEEEMYERIESVARMVGTLYSANRFWIADLLLFGEALLGDRFYQLAEALGLRPETMVDWRRVAEKVPRSRRRQALRFSHHRAVAALDPPAQDYWLGQAEERSLTVQDLENELRAAREAADGGGDGPPGVEASISPTRVVEVARQILAVASSTADGDWIVPDAQMSQLRAALGADE